jgi:hypothetical protein
VKSNWDIISSLSRDLRYAVIITLQHLLRIFPEFIVEVRPLKSCISVCVNGISSVQIIIVIITFRMLQQHSVVVHAAAIFIFCFRTHLVRRPPTRLGGMKREREPSPGLSFRYRNQQLVPNLPRSLHQEPESRRNGPPFIPQMLVPVFRGRRSPP